MDHGSFTVCLDLYSKRMTHIYYFVNLGEETGNIDQNLKVLSEMYSKKLNNDIKYIVQIMQPALIIFITVIVGGLMSGLILPMLDYSKFI